MAKIIIQSFLVVFYPIFWGIDCLVLVAGLVIDFEERQDKTHWPLTKMWSKIIKAV